LTYEGFKFLVGGLLPGDNVLPSSDDVILPLLNYALTTTATKADSLHLMTLSTAVPSLRLAQGDYLIRTPELPEDDVDVIDIDEELIFAVARYMASYISKDKGGIHVQAADRIILDYNCKVYEIIEQMQLEAIDAGLPDTGDDCSRSTADTEFVAECSTEFVL